MHTEEHVTKVVLSEKPDKFKLPKTRLLLQEKVGRPRTEVQKIEYRKGNIISRWKNQINWVWPIPLVRIKFRTIYRRSPCKRRKSNAVDVQKEATCLLLEVKKERKSPIVPLDVPNLFYVHENKKIKSKDNNQNSFEAASVHETNKIKLKDNNQIYVVASKAYPIIC